MTEEKKKRISRYAAWPVSLLVLGGMFFGAKAVSDAQFDAATASASETEVQIKDGLWNYNALSAREQRLYEVLYDAMEGREDRTERVSFVPTQTEFSAAFDAVLYDHPMFCDLLREECALLAADHSAQMSLAYLPDGDTRRQTLEQTVNTLLASVSAIDERMAAVQAHDVLTARCTYLTPSSDGDAAFGETAYDALVIGDAGSSGYALAYTLLCRSAGIDCAVVRGVVNNGVQTGPHAWNVLHVGGESGFTDVMWDDPASSEDGTADGTEIPFHGYYFLSRNEMAADHTPLYDFNVWGDTSDYYEQMNLCADSAETLEQLLQLLLTEARRAQKDTVEFRLTGQLNMTDYALEEVLAAAIHEVNADQTLHTPQLRPVNRVYHTAKDGGKITVQLFYEESEPLGETQ